MADLYTNKPKSYPGNTTASASATSSAAAAAATGAPPAAGGAFADWNFAMDARQYISGGVDVPACYQYNNGQLGNRVTSGYTMMAAADFCSCAYKNYDP